MRSGVSGALQTSSSPVLSPKRVAVPEPRSFALFLLKFGVLLLGAEGTLRGIAIVQEEIGRPLVDAGGSFALAGLVTALANALFSLTALVALLIGVKWR